MCDALAVEWRARYEAVAAGVSDPAHLELALRVVAGACAVSNASGQPFGVVFAALMDVIRLQQNQAVSHQVARAG